MNMKRLFYLVLLFSSMISGSAQQWDWAKDVGRTFTDGSPQIKTNDNGDVFASGTFFGTAQLADTSFYSDTSFYWNRGNYVARFNNAGNLMWAQLIGGQNTLLSGISIDKKNHVYAVGRFAVDLKFSDTTIYGSGVFIAAFDTEGKRIWFKTFQNMSSNSSVANDVNDNLIFANSTQGDNKLTLMKLNELNGNTIWANAWTTTPLTLRGIRIDNQNKIILGGSFGGDVLQLNDQVYFQEQGWETSSCIARISESGNIENVNIVRGGVIRDFELDQLNHIYLIGQYNDKMKVGDINFKTDICDENNCEEYFIAKLSSSGEAVWAKKREDEYSQGSIAVSKEGEVYYSGSFHQNIAFDNVSLHESVVRHASFIFKFNTNGVAQWAMKDEGDYIIDAFTYDLAYSESNVVYLCGRYHNFSGHIWFGNDTLPETGFYDHIFFAKALDNFVPTAIELPDDENDLVNVLPNPSAGKFTINIAKAMKDASILVYDVSGNCILTQRIEKQQTHTIDIGDQPKGIYLIEIRSGSEKFVKKVTLN